MHRSAKWLADEAARRQAELQKLVYGGKRAAPASAAQALYPNHNSSSRQVGIARGDTAQPTTRRHSIASIVYPKLPSAGTR